MPAEWIPTLKVIERLRVTYSTLHYWREASCPWLGGKLLRARGEGHGREYVAAHVEAIATAMASADGTEAGWITTRAAEAKFGVTRTTLAGWRERGCSFWGGRKPRARRAPAKHFGQAGPREGWLYLEEDLAAIAAARTTGGEIRGGAEPWPSAREVAGRLGVTAGAVWFWIREGCPYLGGKRPRTHARHLMTNPAHPRPGLGIDPAQVAQIEAAMRALAGGREGGGWVTAAEAEARFGFVRGDLWRWHRKHCAYLGGRRLAAKEEVGIADGTRQARRLWRFSLADLEAIRQAKANGDSSPGAWLGVKAARAQYGLSKGLLGWWRKHPCPLLGRKLRCKQIQSRSLANACRLIWVYQDEDLKRIAEARGLEVLPASETVRGAASSAPPQAALPPEFEGHPVRLTNRILDVRIVDRDDLTEDASGPTIRRPPGRPRGTGDPDVARRKREMLEAWDRGEYGGNKSRAGRAHGFCRADATKYINKHMRGRKNPRGKPCQEV